MTLDKAALKACNIVYELEPSKPPPTYVRKIKATLLDFGFAGFEDIVDLNSDFEYKSIEEKCQDETQKALLYKANEDTKEVRTLYKQACNEADWQQFYSGYFRGILKSCSNELHTDNRQ